MDRVEHTALKNNNDNNDKNMNCGERKMWTVAPSEDPSEISSRYVRASEPPLSRGGSVEEEEEGESVSVLT